MTELAGNPASDMATPAAIEAAVTVEVAQYNLSLTVEWIKFAEGKATAILTFAVALIGVSLTEIPDATKVIQALVEQSRFVIVGGIVLSHVAFYVTAGAAIYYALTVVRPKLITKSNRHSWFFFQSMSLLTPEDYKSFCGRLDADTLLAQLCDQIYNNSVVAKDKFREVKTALNFGVAAGCLAIVAVLPTLILKGILNGSQS